MGVGRRAYGYLVLPQAQDVDQGAPEGEPPQVAALTVAAAWRGYQLAGVFSDVAPRSDAGFYELLDAVRRDGVSAVVVPDLSHLAHVGCLEGADVRAASRYLKVKVILAAEPG